MLHLNKIFKKKYTSIWAGVNTSLIPVSEIYLEYFVLF